MELIRCSNCQKTYLPEQIKKDAFIWLTLGDTSGFQTENFNICHRCAGLLLWELKSYIHQKLNLKKP